MPADIFIIHIDYFCWNHLSLFQGKIIILCINGNFFHIPPHFVSGLGVYREQRPDYGGHIQPSVSERKINSKL
jgi:hypothetical protein